MCIRDRFEVLYFGSHRYALSLPDSDVDVQLILRSVDMQGPSTVDVCMGIGEAIRTLSHSWPRISNVSDSATNHKIDDLFKVWSC